MERLEGVPLSYRADETKILPDEVIGILLQVCDALIAAHAANVVHRDLKLDNVFLIDNPDEPSQPRVKLLDWGIAKIISNDVRHTIEGQLVGTPQYLAPEQARGAAVSPQTDVYSLGVMAYELFLEQLPFEAETSAEIMAMHLRATPPAPSELWPDIPPSLEHLLLAMLAKDPASRPTMLAVAHTLEMVRAELARRRRESIEPARPAAPSEPRSSRFASTPGLAPTEPVHWRSTSKRWHVAVGAFALAASATMFAISRDPETAAAAPPREIADETVAAGAHAEPAAPTPGEHAHIEPAALIAGAHAEPAAPTPGEHAHIEPAALIAGAHAEPAGRTAGAHAEPTAGPLPEPTEPVAPPIDAPVGRADAPPVAVRTAPAPTSPSRRASRPETPVTPRRVKPLDPDGTLDPYR
jgi:serine/threonine-protein kinase